ncbi:cytochrome c biogenesis heme-transporting ATPase CcmA [Lamprobacter modestohalophilus]|uniref:cytochrome c biogenesis heme-transporting ATPase CcmA n=1 Tax=Lamprobacter modestohalophilus TaxID=1064514 RepID=UPI002ADEC111|nr:cytochrome c biogenesis heme-transporting ATPase CcmA [Lamprobacter modestohalophilus]MEA1050687.1 cytochrome c biogenesis heme-transporting ATPase CcmA [Lamprobacter modestohalophilus]
MLDVSDLACRRGERLLFSGLSFQVPAETLLHVRGRNGSGKTTLLRALCGLLRADAGSIRWRGERIRDLAEDYNRDLLYFGHLNGIKADLTGLENLRIASILDQDPADEGAIFAALSRIGLEGFEDLPTRMLSQGQKKRVALARLILSKAPLWILDEPFTALDVDAVDLLQQLIAEQVARGGSVILTTHQEVPLTSGAIQRLTLGEASDPVSSESTESETRH